MSNVYLILPQIIQNKKLIQSDNFVSTEYIMIGDVIYVYLNYINKNESFYNWLYFLCKKEINFYSMNLDEQDASKIKCTYVVPKNKFLFCKSVLTDCMQNIDIEYVKEIISWYK